MSNEASITSNLIVSNSESMLIIYQKYVFFVMALPLLMLINARGDTVFFMKKYCASYIAKIDVVPSKFLIYYLICFASKTREVIN
jgi:hypothetical protein